MNRLILENVSKKIGKRTILDEINIEFYEGRVYGIVGENGAGKTIFYKTISELISTTTGQLLFNDKSYRESKPCFGIVLDDMLLYRNMTVRENLIKLANIRKRITVEQVDGAIRRVGLDPLDKRTFRKCSLGMQHRAVLAQAIMEKPDILLLDEPTNAVDKEGIKLYYEIIREEAKRGAIVIVSSHIEKDILNVADEIFMLKNRKLSRLVANGN